MDAVRRRFRLTGRLTVVTLALLLVVSVGPMARPVAAEDPMPAPGARAAIVMDASTGAILYERNAREARLPASLTKMMTALVAVERAPLDRIVRVSHPIVVTPILIGLEPGDELPLNEALYGLLLNSGNDAALAIAESVGDGSVERFVGWMNQTAERLGLKETHFKNPHGLDTDDHLSSAYDMAIIGRALMRQPALAEMVARDRHVFEGPPRWVFRTRNPLIGNYDGADGIKTGFDDLAGLCLVATGTRDGRRAIAVVMDSTNYGRDAASLLDYAFGDTRWGPLRVPQPPGRSASERLGMLRADVADAGADRPAHLLGAGRIGSIAEPGGPT